MRKVTILTLVLLAAAVAVGVPAAEAVGGGGTSVCAWTCNCAGQPVCTCPPGTSGFCVYPPNIGCTQVYNC